MPPSSQGRESARPSPSPVKVLSVPGGVPIVVKFLGQVQGLNTHWKAGRSHPCPGPDDCPSSLHRIPPIWKGYAPVEVWEAVPQIWRAWVLEVTESLEEQLRKRQLRGETWTLFRAGGKRKTDPVQAVFCERVEENKVSPAFDLLPVLQRLYHCQEIRFGAANPLPPRVVIEPIHGDAPTLPAEMRDLDTPADNPQTRKELAELWKQLRARMGGARPDQAGDQAGDHQRNGQAHERNGQ